MAITLSTGGGGNGSLTYAVTIPASGNDRLLIVWMAKEIGAVNWSNPTYNGGAAAAGLTNAIADGNGAAGTMHWWFDADLPASAGSYNISGIDSLGSDCGTHWAVYTGVDQAAPDDTHSSTVTTAAGTADPTYTAVLDTVVADSLIVMGVEQGSDPAVSTNNGAGTVISSVKAGAGGALNPMVSSYTIDATTGTGTSYSQTFDSGSRGVILGATFAPAAATQIARPDADVSVGAWVTDTGASTGLFEAINEAIAVDADYVRSPTDPANAPYVVGLGSLVDPAVSTGHIVRYRYLKSGTATIDLTVQLVQGYVNEGTPGTVIEEWVHSGISTTATTATQTLGPTEADAISDYADLALRFVADKPA